ncbi:MAG: choice-of-anchor W domain-containing protein [Planctomycetota bacterium]
MMFSRVRTGAIAAAVIATGPSFAAIDADFFEGDSNRFDFFFDDSEQAVAEARYGSNTANGDWELGVGADTQQTGEFTQANNVWGNGVSEAFTVFYDDSAMELTFTVGSTTIDYTLDAPLTVNDIALRIGFNAGSGAGNGNSASLDTLAIDGTPLSPSSLTSTFDEAGAKYLFVEDAFVLGDDFTLTGNLTFAWSATNPALSGSRPSFQVKFVNAIPEPASLALLGGGLLALMRRR